MQQKPLEIFFKKNFGLQIETVVMSPNRGFQSISPFVYLVFFFPFFLIRKVSAAVFSALEPVVGFQ